MYLDFMLPFKLYFLYIQMVGQLVLYAILEMEFHTQYQYLKVSLSTLLLADPKLLEEVSPINYKDFMNKLMEQIDTLLTLEKSCVELKKPKI